MMEKCDYDLQHHLNAVKALNEPATKDFLFQLGKAHRSAFNALVCCALLICKLYF